MNNVIPVSDFRNNISEYLNRVLYNEETLFIKKGKSSRLVKITIDTESNKKRSNLDEILSLGDTWTKEEAEEFELSVKDLCKNQEDNSVQRMKQLLQQLS